MIRCPRGRALAAVAIVVGAMLVCAAGDAFAGHLRGVTISWRSTANPGEVEFRFQYAGRWSALGTPPVGTSHSETVNFGDGLTGVATGPITSINPAEDWFVADLRVVHAYAGPGPYTAFYSNYSRMSGVRNAAPMMRLETLVRPMSGNSSPTSGSPPPVISISVGSQAGFVVPAFDVDADSLRFRLSTAAESGISSQPPGLSIDPATGRVTWNTGTLGAGALYAVQFTVEDLDASGEMRSKIPIDLTLRIARSSGSLPTIAIGPPGPWSVQTGTPITFTVTGVDLDPGDKITLGSGSLPVGATMTPAVGAARTSPVASTFQWTPAPSQGGSYTLTFIATDTSFNRASATVSMAVQSHQPPTVACGPPVTAVPNSPVPISVAIQDAGGEALTVVWSVDGSVVRTDSVTASPTGTTVTLAQAFGTVGAHTVAVTVRDSGNASAACSTVVNVSKSDQVISFQPIGDRAFGDSPFALSATASSNLPVLFAVIAGPAAVTNGSLITIFGPGLVVVRASQPGDANYNAATEVDRTFTVGKAPSSVTLTSSANPSFRRQDVTFAAMVAGPPDTAVPSGTIAFQDSGSRPLAGPIALDTNGQATLTINTLEIGDHLVTAVFSGDGLFNGSTSVVLTQSIPNRAPRVSLPPAFTTTEGATPLLLTATVDDDDEDPVAVTWTLVSGQGALEGAELRASFSARNGPATAVVRVTASDPHGGSASADTMIAVENVTPVVSIGGDALVDEGALFERLGSFADPGEDTWTATVDFGDGSGKQGLALSGDKTFVLSHRYAQDGRYEVSVIVADGDGEPAGATFSVTVGNVAPLVGPLGLSPTTLVESGTVIVTGSFSDPGLIDPHTLAIDWGDGTATPSVAFTQTAPGVYRFSAFHQYLDDVPSQTASDICQVIVTVSDDRDARNTAAQVRVNNVAPTISSVTGPTSPLLLGSAAPVSVTFSDPGQLDTITCSFTWADGGAETVVPGADGACAASHTYTAPGVYAVSVAVADDDGGTASSAFSYVVVYDPEAGSVTGGGWITSPTGALAADPSARGRANLGFNARYQGGLPVGQTEFRFRSGNLNFHSSTYVWLVISQSTAEYEGTGTVDGTGSYGFLVTVVDGKLAGTHVDRVRIKIWDHASGAIVYDDRPGAPDNADATTRLSGGNVVIHR